MHACKHACEVVHAHAYTHTHTQKSVSDNCPVGGHLIEHHQQLSVLQRQGIIKDDVVGSMMTLHNNEMFAR